MRIQSIYTNNQTNFNARFINDKNGNFQKPWNDALKSTDFFNKAEKFSNGLPSDSLEILSIKTLDLVTSGYEVFNHNTWKKSLYKINTNLPKHGALASLLDIIYDGRTLFEKDFSTYIHNFLLGKK